MIFGFGFGNVRGVGLGGWPSPSTYALLMETSGYILLESGYKILLESDITSTFFILTLDGVDYTVSNVVLDSNGASYTVSKNVLGSDGTSYTPI